MQDPRRKRAGNQVSAGAAPVKATKKERKMTVKTTHTVKEKQYDSLN
jgi:hypothetical protein